ncbi:ester cyclase [Pseudonocardia nantongensis]|uniref:ester cyclase n=1 Tax=Pseudonocardia nantongensis TaxID=1181885 RepID=UPI00397AB39E
MDPFVALMRRYVVHYTNPHDTSVCPEIMEPDYVLRMGPHVVAGRDEAYLPAAQAQFAQFPGLGLTVHEIVTDGTRLALRFSEHGASCKHAGAAATWTGLGLYRWNGARLTDNSVEQDYLTRRRRLAAGETGEVPAPAVAPWDTVAVAADPAAERVVRDWIAAGLPGDAVGYDDGGPGSAGPVLAGAEVVVDDLFSAGPAVAFRLTCTGSYAGGLDDVTAAAPGSPATLHAVGLVHTAGDRVVSGHVVRDRLGCARGLARSEERRPA